MAERELSVAVVGAAYPNKDGGNRRTEITFCDPGQSLELRPEPRNKHDEHAIAVFSARQFQIGYVASERAVFLGGLLREGHTLHAVFQEVAPWGAIARIGVDGPPTDLPPPRDRRTQTSDEYSQVSSDDFFPDELPPDW